MRGRRLRGSYTVEAAIIIPVVLFTMAQGMKQGIDMYKETEATAGSYEEVKELDEVKDIHRYRTLGGIWERLKTDED